ncbi:MAG: TraR/DksA C4-type zinc finger protein [Mobilicoccus sp.]|nr:TraR/DksA C4-type zinc finger protein [Mobilicoccus sp.]
MVDVVWGSEPGGPQAPGAMPVRDGEEPWTAQEVAELEDELRAEITRVSDELALAENDLPDLLTRQGGGAGDDSADLGGWLQERDQEISLGAHHKLLLAQSARALERLAGGSYGVCEQCEEPIGKLRLQAFPRATLCLACKQKSERH